MPRWNPYPTTVPRPPAVGPDFAEDLRDWLDESGWSAAHLARIIGVSEKQAHRWARGEQAPDGIAARRYEAFRSETLEKKILQEMQGLAATRAEVSRISFLSPLTED